MSTASDFVKKDHPEYITKRNAVVTANMGLIGHVLKKIYRPGVARRTIRMLPQEDAQQVGVLALVSAYDNYDPTRGVMFSTYAWWSIHHEIIKTICESSVIKAPSWAFSNSERAQTSKSAAKAKAAVSVRSFVLGRSSEPSVEDPEPVEDDPSVLRIKEFIKKLPPKQGKAIRLRYWGKMTHNQASRYLGITKQGAAAAHNAAIQKLRLHLESV